MSDAPGPRPRSFLKLHPDLRRAVTLVRQFVTGPTDADQVGDFSERINAHLADLPVENLNKHELLIRKRALAQMSSDPAVTTARERLRRAERGRSVDDLFEAADAVSTAQIECIRRANYEYSTSRLVRPASTGQQIKPQNRARGRRGTRSAATRSSAKSGDSGGGDGGGGGLGGDDDPPPRSCAEPDCDRVPRNGKQEFCEKHRKQRERQRAADIAAIQAALEAYAAERRVALRAESTDYSFSEFESMMQTDGDGLSLLPTRKRSHGDWSPPERVRSESRTYPEPATGRLVADWEERSDPAAAKEHGTVIDFPVMIAGTLAVAA